MKRLSFLLLSLIFLTSCSDPFSFTEKGERLPLPQTQNEKETGGTDNGGNGDSTSTPNPDFLQLIQSENKLVLTVHQDSSFNFANFEAEVNYDENKVTLTDITTDINHGFFVWNPDYKGYTDSGLKRAKFAFASADNISDKQLVTLHFSVNETSEVCLVDILYHNIDYKTICVELTK